MFKRPNVAICTDCPLRYCPSCLHDYGETLDKTIKLTVGFTHVFLCVVAYIRMKNWKCPSCRSICQCERCLAEEEGSIELPSEEHSTKIMASRIGKDGERQYCVRWYDKVMQPTPVPQILPAYLPGFSPCTPFLLLGNQRSR